MCIRDSSLDPAEIEFWAERANAGNLYVNRSITGAIVGRQPFGGWKRSAVGPGAKAGGYHYLQVLGTWRRAEVSAPTPADRPCALVDVEVSSIGSLDPKLDLGGVQRVQAGRQTESGAVLIRDSGG